MMFDISQAEGGSTSTETNLTYHIFRKLVHLFSLVSKNAAFPISRKTVTWVQVPQRVMILRRPFHNLLRRSKRREVNFLVFLFLPQNGRFLLQSYRTMKRVQRITIATLSSKFRWNQVVAL